MSDAHWNPLTPGADAYRSWLRAPGSLTQRISLHCQRFSVLPLDLGNTPVTPDEAGLIGAAAGRYAYRRDVLLLADGRPVVFAHSVVAHQHLRGAWSALQRLGNRPLGPLLFANPHIQRGTLHYRKLACRHPLYRPIAAAGIAAPPILWARRSLFVLHDAPLLVTEVFLPAILELTRCG